MRRPSRRLLSYLYNAAAIGTVSTAAQSLARKVVKTMMIQQIMLVSAALITLGVIAWVASAVLTSRDEEPSKVMCTGRRRKQGHSRAQGRPRTGSTRCSRHATGRGPCARP